MVWPNEPIYWRLLMNILKYFRFWYFELPKILIWLFVHYTYSQYMYRFVLCILSIEIDLNPIIAVYEQIHSKYLGYVMLNMYSKIPFEDLSHSAFSSFTNRFIPHILSIRTDSSAYSQYKNRFIPHILSIRTDSSRIFSV